MSWFGFKKDKSQNNLQTHEQTHQQNNSQKSTFKGKDQKKIEKLQQACKQYQQKVQKYQKTIKKNQKTIKQLDQKVEQLKRQVQLKNSIINIKISDSKDYEAQMNKKLSSIQTQNNQLVDSMKSRDKEILKLKKQLQEACNIKDQLGQIKKVNKKLGQNLQEMRLKYEKEKQKYQKEKNNEIDQIKQRNKRLEQSLEGIKQKYENQKETYEKEKNDEIDKIKELNKRLEESLENLKLQFQRERQNYQKQKQNNLGINYRFGSDILHSLSEQKVKPLVSQIENGTGKKIVRSSFLYKFNKNPNCNVNPHLVIDGVPNILLLIRLKNGQILGGFSEKEFFKPTQIIQQWPHWGAIFNLNKNKFFYLKKQAGKKVLNYDAYYIAFGNNQIRIRHGQNIVYTNFAAKNGDFDSKDSKQDDLLGCGQLRQTQFDYFEFHQAIFNQKIQQK